MISVIVPTLNEEQYLPNLLTSLEKHSFITEVIITDGGSSDLTEQVALNFPKVKWVQGAKGRAIQMNYGASVAKGEILFFLHADSQINDEAIDQISQTLDTAMAGSCYLAFDTRNFFLDNYSRLSKFNISLFTYGDQGLFMRKSTFESIKGFKGIPIMEDFEMVCKIKKRGRFVKLDYPVTTSSRRYLQHGVVKQQLKNIVLVAMYSIGISPFFISRFYKY